MTIDPARPALTLKDRHRLLVVLLLTLLPWPAVWLGMYHWHSLVDTFILYHGVCLLPAAIWGRRLWQGAVRLPTRRQVALILAAMLAMVPLSLLLYALIGKWLFDVHSVMSVVTKDGFRAIWLLPVGLYFVPVNATLEELFWRGVVLNELRGVHGAALVLAEIWTALTFAGWHYLVLRLLLQPGWAELSVLVILGAGVLLSWMYRVTRSIIVPILWHALVFDLALIVVFGAIIRAS